TVDEMARHAITKLSEIHFAATESSAERIRKMGELPFNIHLVGAPGLDSILNDILPSKEEVFKSLGLNSSEKTVLIVQHPITLEDGKSEEHMRATLEAVKEEGFQVIVVYPNADAGGREMISVIEEYEGTFNIFKSMERSLFLSLMKNSDLIIGNSSSALIEAPSFGTPAVNIGSRQSGRERSDNIIDSGYKKDEIISAIKKALSPEFIKKAEKCENPYGDGKSGERIVKILKEVELGRELLDKKIAY
ncbi:MAG: UDP-N-acetylglucosamine 2-epimerase, partial [archaeon]|nr:UDP-N-acetylglucosamine 2-epimerase [archaeon]